MPIYEYVCNACGYHFERIQSFSDDPLQTCPECQGQVRRVISSVGIIFKGSGWYITDSKRQLSATPSKRARQLGDGAGEAKKDDAGEARTKAPAEKSTAKAETGSGGDS